MDLLQHIVSRNETVELGQRVVELLQTLTTTTSSLRSPQPGPALLYSHASGALERTKQLSMLLKRLYGNRLELLRYDGIEHLTHPENWPPGKSYPIEFTEIYNESSSIDEETVMDFQSLFIFGGMLLDEWALLASYVLGAHKPHKCTFDVLAKSEGKSPYSELWNLYRDEILWLDAIPRQFRNKMIMHRELLWQTGHTRSHQFLDWSFWVPIAPGWLTDEEQLQHINKITLLLKKVKVEAPPSNIHSLAFAALDNIALFNIEDRKLISEIAMNVGFATPSFQVFGKKIFAFVISGTNYLVEKASLQPENINFGRRR